jgi:hypothetical protein
MNEDAPRLLQQPAQAGAPPPRAEEDASVRSFRGQWRALLEGPDPDPPLRARARRVASRMSGRSDRRLLLAVAAATDALATHCDQLQDRLSDHEKIAEDVTAAYGEDLARLRAEVDRLRELVQSLHQTRG